MTCDTYVSISLAANASAGARTPSGNDSGIQNAAFGRYIIYAIEELASGRHYVGLTRRSLEERIASHLTQARRKRRVRTGGLMAALRLMDALGQRFSQCFSARIVARADSSDEARALERHWVSLLACRIPAGLNGMPGGSSIGGIDNARALSVIRQNGVTRTYTTIQAAIAECNAERAEGGQKLLDASTVYARLACGWTTEEALGINPRQDPRAVHPPFALGDAIYTTFQAASEATGLHPATLKSRLHRARQSGAPGTLQIGHDRRARPLGRLRPLLLPWPVTGEHLTAQEYAARTGVPKATVMHRWHRARAKFPDGRMPNPDALHDYLTTPAGGKRGASEALNHLLSQAEQTVRGPSSDIALMFADPRTQ